MCQFLAVRSYGKGFSDSLKLNFGGVGNMSDDSKHKFKNDSIPIQDALKSKQTAAPKNKAVEKHNDIEDRIAGLIGLKKLPDIKELAGKSSQGAFRNGRCRVSVSTDFMSAYFSLEPPQGGGAWPTLAEALQTIKEAGIVTGINITAVKDAIENRLLTEILFAKGAPPTHGADTELRIIHEITDLHRLYLSGLVEDEHGRVDFHRVKSVNSVENGDLVGEKIPAVPGSDGYDLRGQVISGIRGHDKEIKLGKNVVWDDEGLKVYATAGGKPMMIKKCLHVLPIHEVEGNINFHTGNLNFGGNIVVRGDVENGFKVEAEGEIVILGGVEGADIKSGGKLSIQGGVFGMDKSKIECGEDFFAKEIDRVHLKCDGTVLVKDAIRHSRVIAENKVVVEGGKGWIVGGYIRAGESIEARMIGSTMGINTELEVSESHHSPASSAASHEEFSLASSLNDADSPVEVIQEVKTSSQEAPRTTRGRIKFTEQMYPGVRIKIGPHFFGVQNDLTPGVLYCTQQGEFRLLPIK
jgi:uncharacterized protein (DUF342 family)